MAESYVLDQALLLSDIDIVLTSRPPVSPVSAAILLTAGVTRLRVDEAIICPEFQQVFDFETFNEMQSTCLDSVLHSDQSGL